MNTSSATAAPGDGEEPGGAAEIGSELRGQREARGYTLDDVQGYLRIRRNYLEALEAGRFEDLPGTTYLMGFARSYARFLELDADDIVTRVRASQSEDQPRYSLSLPASGREGSLAGVATLLVAVAAVALAIGGWYYFSSNNLSITDLGRLFEDNPAATPDPLGPAPPEDEPAAADAAPPGGEPDSNLAPSAAGSPDTAGQASEPPPADSTETAPRNRTENAPADGTETAPADSAEAAPANGTEAAPADGDREAQVAAEAPDPAPGGTAAPTTSQSAESTPAAAPAETPPDPSPASQPAAEPEAPAGDGATPQVVLQATGETFIALRTPDGEIFLSRLLRAGEAYEIPPEHPNLILDTGNAGTLRIVVDGRTLPPLGAVGAVIRNVPLDPRGLLERGR